MHIALQVALVSLQMDRFYYLTESRNELSWIEFTFGESGIKMTEYWTVIAICNINIMPLIVIRLHKNNVANIGWNT